MNGSTSNEGKYLIGNRKQMEACEPLNSKNRPKRCRLTPLRVFRGVLCLVILLSTAFMMLIYWAPVTALLLRLFSVHYSRKATSILFGTWLSLWPFLFEKINKTKVVFSGESVPEKERVLLFANHRTEVDWMYLWDLALRKGRLGYIKYILKSSLMKLPIFSWGFHILEFIPVERKWEVDEAIMWKRLSAFKDPQDPLWLAVFPEGTDYTEQKCIKSQQFAAENGLPILRNVLLPKTKGFNSCLEALRNSLDAVYDITIGYKHRCPLFIDNVFGVDPSEVHIHVQRILPHEIPASENEVAAWLIERFRLKDQQLSDFLSLGYFPHQGTEGDLSTPTCLVKCFVVITLTSIFIYLTLFSSVLFKIYASLSFTLLSFVTYFGIQPQPVLGSVKGLFCGKKTC
ncbi:probable 1-acyl-sn-glycerol-3-phosphate acyltransferase 4 [Phoenix dactylifera]|uniref:1-acylglycerol-3-phosphate O-acyltransferase n=1 Tax=Phoenix dactylifera TaxID=42345 RepID=A0A8B7C2K0_PHODC|nr:probable 1-acyl-sn-glycerol-3-phosphate acyltransferase 4 [Phoenix dactylifera]XP_008790233.1 probable 1-acyl-sn-glycerol-3-phosphate acyltransferase 4 [Phoenix dactylifera]